MTDRGFPWGSLPPSHVSFGKPVFLSSLLGTFRWLAAREAATRGAGGAGGKWQ